LAWKGRSAVDSRPRSNGLFPCERLAARSFAAEARHSPRFPYRLIPSRQGAQDVAAHIIDLDQIHDPAAAGARQPGLDVAAELLLTPSRDAAWVLTAVRDRRLKPRR
jgi:hypothetical protein